MRRGVFAVMAASLAFLGAAPGGQHGFDFEFGAWKAHISRQPHPLSADKHWVQCDGSSVVHPIWNGNANIGELDVSGPECHIVGASLRFYNPESGQWSVSWVNSSDPEITSPMVGGFAGDRGEFYGQDTLRGRAIFSRFIFSDFTPTSFKIVQSFSDDGGKTWDPNWIATFEKTP